MTTLTTFKPIKTKSFTAAVIDFLSIFDPVSNAKDTFYLKLITKESSAICFNDNETREIQTNDFLFINIQGGKQEPQIVISVENMFINIVEKVSDLVKETKQLFSESPIIKQYVVINNDSFLIIVNAKDCENFMLKLAAVLEPRWHIKGKL